MLERGDERQLDALALLVAGVGSGAPVGEVELVIPGRHNVANALGAIAATQALGVGFQRVQPTRRDLAEARRLAGSFAARFPDSPLKADARLVDARAALARYGAEGAGGGG